MQKRHHVIRDVGQSMLAAVRSELSAQKSKAKAFLATPTVEFLRKNQPCAVLYLYDLRPFIRINSGEKWELEEEIVDEDGETYVVRYGRPLEMQLKYLFTASAEDLADEHEILALAMKTFLESPRLSREQLVGESFGSSDGLAISTDTDFTLDTCSKVFGGFDSPVGKLDSVKGGSTVPLKFQVFDWNGRLVVAVGQVQRPDRVVPQAGGREHLQPDGPAPQRQLHGRPGWLADRPEHAEVADGRPLGPRGPVEHGDPPAAAGQVIGVGQAEDAGPDHGVTELAGHPAPRARRRLSRGR